MNTVIKDWVIVSVIDDEFLVGKVLWGIVIDDMSCRFIKDDYVCSSKIIDINIHNQLIKTFTGSLYQIIGNGHRAEIKFEEFELLRQGFNPKQIRELRESPDLVIH